MVTLLTVLLSCAVLAGLLAAILRIHWFVFAADSPRQLVYCERANVFAVTTLSEYHRAGWMTFGTSEVVLPDWELVFTNEKDILCRRNGSLEDFEGLMDHSKLVRVANMFVPFQVVPPVALKCYRNAMARVHIPGWNRAEPEEERKVVSHDERLDRAYRHLYGFGKDSLRAKLFFFACDRDDIIVPLMTAVFICTFFLLALMATWNGTISHILSLGTRLL